MRADLHLHSTLSDGWSSVEDSVELAARAGVEVVSLTDHDQVQGLDRAQRSAHELGVAFVAGIEITTHPLFGGLHVLGHGVDPAHASLLDLITRAHEVWAAQRDELAAMLGREGIFVRGEPDPASVMPQSTVRLLMQDSMPERKALQLYRAAQQKVVPLVDSLLPSLDEAVGVVHAAGGLAVLAHPGLIRDEATLMRALDRVDAVEVHTRRHSPSDVKRLLSLARSAALPATAGSDYHGYLGEAYELCSPVHVDRRYLEILGERVRRPDSASTRGGD